MVLQQGYAWWSSCRLPSSKLILRPRVPETSLVSCRTVCVFVRQAPNLVQVEASVPLVFGI